MRESEQRLAVSSYFVFAERRIEVILRVPGKTQGQHGVPGARLAMKQKRPRLDCQYFLQASEVGFAAHEVLRTIVRKIYRRFQSREPLNPLSPFQPVEGLAYCCGLVPTCIDAIAGAQQRWKWMVAKQDDAETNLVRLHLLRQKRGQSPFGPG